MVSYKPKESEFLSATAHSWNSLCTRQKNVPSKYLL